MDPAIAENDFHWGSNIDISPDDICSPGEARNEALAALGAFYTDSIVFPSPEKTHREK
jgi:hypothetical protein